MDHILICIELIYVSGRKQMLTFKKGDNVKVRIDAKIPFNGRIGIIDVDPIDESLGYLVKFASEVCTWHYLLAPEDITLLHNP
jgi:hypothetical protein